MQLGKKKYRQRGGLDAYCWTCNRLFHPTRPDAKTCSSKCRVQMARTKRKAASLAKVFVKSNRKDREAMFPPDYVAHLKETGQW